ncbi:hypothetical protein HELRODRAFT_155947 [Helobdella robusta]|uniref:Nicotinate-nucleotide pyrophosphorylase [carboxylating] n=1 Tax=Helobdella robusta TaxID=6412 RepID=T1ELP5_HELRO|nr:hypothetical protein HELRODRAFT_155947 [Helobdella robusta]ESN99124.1 hypothetical protein HELRODRAFT_155947 [Helobdella robusta]
MDVGDSRQPLKFAHLLHPTKLRKLVNYWLEEDTSNFDYGGFVVGEKIEKAYLLGKCEGILAGSPFFEEVFRSLDCSVDWHISEGSLLKPVVKVATVTGKVRNVLLGERVALNCLARSSGVATYAKKLNDVVKQHIVPETGMPWHGEIAGTRKTTPGFRLVEKYALLVGGISTHRYDLSSMIMLKDNHIWSAGSITNVIKDARSVGGFNSKIEVECRSLEEALEAAEARCDIIMLDNFELEALHKTASIIKNKFQNILIEASGGVNEDNILDYVGKNIDVISLSRTTQGYNILDFSLKIQKFY